MRRIALGGLVVVVAAAACDRTPREKPDFARESATPAEALPTPEPPPDGEWGLVVDSAGDACAVGTPPDRVRLASDRFGFQIALQPFFLDAQGRLEGDALSLTGSARVIHRPTVDCVIDEREVWRLRRTAPASLAGELSRTREVAAGDDCADVTPAAVTLPCTSRWQVRLDHGTTPMTTSTSAP